jgi:hypothetical protein
MSYIKILVLIASFTGYTQFLSYAYKVKLNISIPLALALLMSCNFLAALANVLPICVNIMHLIGFALFYIFSLKPLLAQRNENPYVISKEILALVSLLLIYYLRVVFAYYSSWDDFSHWGVSIKDIYYHNGLVQPGEQSSIMKIFFHYPQLMSLFHYSTLKIIDLTEGNNIFIAGVTVILFSTVLMIENRYWLNIWLLLAALAPLTLFTTALRSVMVDGTVCAAFGAALSLFLQTTNYKRYLVIAPLIFILPNIKEVGLWLSLATILSIFLAEIFAYKQKKFAYILTLLLALVPYYSQLLWQRYLARFNWQKIEKKKLSLQELFFKVVYSYQSHEDTAIFTGFLKSVYKFIFSEGAALSYFLIAISFYLVHKFEPSKLKSLASYYLVLLVCFIVYLIFRLSLYYTHFNYAEAIRGASGVRYYGTFAAGFIFVALTYTRSILLKLDTETLNSLKPAGIISALIFFCIVTHSLAHKPLLSLSTDRKQLRAIAEELALLDIYNNKVLIGIDNVSSVNCLELYLEFADGRNRSLYEQCLLGTSPEQTRLLGDDFFKQIIPSSFNNCNNKHASKEKYDYLYVAKPSTTTLEQLSKLLNLKLSESTNYIFCIQDNKFKQVHLPLPTN